MESAPPSQLRLSAGFAPASLFTTRSASTRVTPQYHYEIDLCLLQLYTFCASASTLFSGFIAMRQNMPAFAHSSAAQGRIARGALAFRTVIGYTGKIVSAENAHCYYDRKRSETMDDRPRERPNRSKPPQENTARLRGAFSRIAVHCAPAPMRPCCPL